MALLLASGAALADSAQLFNAAQVNFVIGQVSASTPGGRTRFLHKGDVIASGDRISTHDGRVQLRFSDGGFVSLQPGTVFGVDAYVFDASKPEQGGAYFNLLRGGVRCVTGSIGHDRHSSYRVKTPLASLRVRGSEYLASYDGSALHVTAGQGRVALENEYGSINLLSGQSADVEPYGAPEPTDDSPELVAAGPGELFTQPAVYSAMTGDQQGSNGLPVGLLPPVVVTLPNSVNGAPTYSLIVPGELGQLSTVPTGNGGAAVLSPGAGSVYQDVQASFADHTGALQTVVAPTGTVFDNTGNGALAYDGIGNETVISFGELSAGSSRVGGITAVQGQFIPYVVGLTGSAPTRVGSVSYALAAPGDATPARLYDGETGQASTGSVTLFNISLDLTNLQLTMDLQVQMTGATGSTGVTGAYETKVTALSVPTLGQSGGFTLDNLATTGPTGGVCGSNCAATISGFFVGPAGARLGTAYDIDTSAGSILGVAALTQSGPPAISSSAPLVSSTSPLFSFATPTGSPALSGDTSNYLYSALSGTFATASIATTAPAAGVLLSLATSAATPAVLFNNTGSTPLQYNGLTTLGDVSYAELTNGSGTLALTGSSSTTETLSAGSYQPYIVGTTGSEPDANLGTVLYSLQAGTTPRLNGTQGGSLNQFTIALNLGQLTLSADLQVGMAGTVYGVQASNLPASSLGSGGNSFMLTGLGVSGGTCSAGACSADIGGFYAGQGATQLGAAYAINLSGVGVVTGVAALSQAAVAAAYTSGYGSSATEVLGAIGAYGDTSAANTGLLGVANGSSTALQRTTAITAADVGTDGTLEWGRWTSGTPTVDGTATSATLSGNDSVHYVTGQQTPAAALYALASQPGLLTYTLEQHGTTPTNGTTTGSLQSGSLQVNFAAETMQVDLQLALGTKGYTVNDHGGLTAGSATFNLSNLATTGTGGACASSCSASVSGFFAGSQADKVGLGYAVSDTGSGVLRGTAGFGRP